MCAVIAISWFARASYAQPATVPTPECKKTIACCDAALKIDSDFFSGPSFCNDSSIARYRMAASESDCVNAGVRIREQIGLLARALPNACAIAPQPPPDGWWSATEPNGLFPPDVGVRFAPNEIDYAGNQADRVAASLQPVAPERWQLYGLSAGLFDLRRHPHDRLLLTGGGQTIELRRVPSPRAKSFAASLRELPDPWQSCQTLAACCEANRPDSRAALSCRAAALAELTTRPSSAKCLQMLASLSDWYRSQKKAPPVCAAQGSR
jgi:hypothetical protein